jgi:hypothetical protein
MVRRAGCTLMGLLLAGAMGLSAQSFAISFTPAQPLQGQPVTITVTSSFLVDCYARDPVPVLSGTTIDVGVESCFIDPPFPRELIQESWEVGPLPAGTYTVRFRLDGEVFAQKQLTVPACAPDRLCFQEGRFEVRAEWVADISSFGTATPIQLTADTGYFWFFQPENVELLVKVIDGCFLNGHFWFFAAGLTNVETRITVTDTLLGTTQTYTNPRGTPFAPVQATSTFGCD